MYNPPMTKRDPYAKPKSPYTECDNCGYETSPWGLAHTGPEGQKDGNYCSECCSHPCCKVQHAKELKWEAEERDEWKAIHSAWENAVENELSWRADY